MIYTDIVINSLVTLTINVFYSKFVAEGFQKQKRIHKNNKKISDNQKIDFGPLEHILPILHEGKWKKHCVNLFGRIFWEIKQKKEKFPKVSSNISFVTLSSQSLCRHLIRSHRR